MAWIKGWLVVWVGVLSFGWLGAAEELPWTHFTPEHQAVPLPSASVQTLLQDRQGYIWIGFFSSGLARYDGKGLEVYSIADGLPDSTVRQTVVDSDGYLWIGCESGVVVSERPLQDYPPHERLRFLSEVGGNELVRARIRHNWMAAAPEGGVWVATAGQGLFHYRRSADELEINQVSSDLDGDRDHDAVSAIRTTSDNTLWVAFENASIATLASGQSRLVGLSLDSPLPAVITAMVTHPDGSVWGGCRNGLIFRIASGSNSWEEIATLDERVAHMIVTSKREVWVGSLGGGVIRIEPGGDVSNYRRRQGLISQTVWELLEDTEKTIWIGHNAGFSRLRSDYRAFGSFTGTTVPGSQPLLPEPTSFAVLEPAPGSTFPETFVGTGGGLAAIRSDDLHQSLTIADGLASNSIYAISRDAEERVWIGSLGGLNVISPIDKPLPQASEPIAFELNGQPALLQGLDFGTTYDCSLLPLNTGNGGTVPSIWTNGPAGLAIYVGERTFRFGPSAGLPAAGSGATALESSGRALIGTRDLGLFRSTEPIDLARLEGWAGEGETITQRVFEPFWNREKGAPSNSVHNLVVAGNRTWVGTASGLVALKSGSVEIDAVLGAENGLGGDRIMGMAIAPNGHLWVTQNEGLAEVDPTTAEVVRTVSKADGLVDNEVWVSSSLTVGADGTVMMATPKGLSLYRSRLDTRDESTPLLAFARTELSQSFSGSNELNLAYRALSFTNESMIRFKHRLVGFDQDWSEPTTDTRIRYTNLPAFAFSKTYVFELVASNADGAWGTVPVAFEATIKPAWYARWWALLLFLGIAAGGYHASMHRLREHNRELSAAVEARTSELEDAYQRRESERAQLERELANSSEHLAALSTDMNSTADDTSSQATRVSSLAEDVSTHVLTISTAIEELSVSTREIANNASEAAVIAAEGVMEAEATNQTVGALGASSSEIDEVIKVITGIAKQTNLLALNATIEAARAGEAGRGFAVVANEVKDLALGTSEAAEDVRNRVQALKSDSGRAMEAIAGIATIIERIYEIQTTIAAAVEENTATATEISRSIMAAANGSSEIAEGIAQVAKVAEGSSEAAASTQEAAIHLATIAARAGEQS